ncbi:hypothetical protein [Campylobacter sp. MIT 97-5078]|uniref:hypothetical protein n=1 Tax=Campylobacter sp. MIT 97-5078 TaxID=1548153 RepID=UPI0005129C4B|nr:hypothetical protein [Campylobacter sp. MIT 97-5078]KGI56318.1 hypothetical protein LR59_07790 [Campylobacter sp. MIT 97-5078]KGI57553.1 hypothetical protein LR59_02350 [Campylobacter sp. MIT 97-5078]KGI57750.1 hypothetical protein LR59_03465 [Campylobacter sp. MIT 97-5078]TQR26923.1 hypothetical protein DMB91_05970 [Campylobacter sp. MIT 97-5078]
MSLESIPNLLLYTTQDKKVKVELYELGESVFLTQDSIAKLFTFAGLHLKKLRFDTSKSSISEHITNILKEGELSEVLVCKDYLHTATDSKQYKNLIKYKFQAYIKQSHKGK